MPLYDLNYIKDAKEIKVGRKGAPDPARIRLTMVLVSIQPKQFIVQATDFTPLFGSSIITFNILNKSPAIMGLKDLLRLYPNTANIHTGKATFLDNNTIVLLNLTANVYNGAFNFNYTITDFKIINHDPKYVFKTDIKHQLKLKFLVEQLSKMELIKNLSNKEEYDKILAVVSRPEHLKRPNEEDEKEVTVPKKTKIIPSDQAEPETSNETSEFNVLNMNPLFNLPTQVASQFPLLSPSQLESLSPTQNEHPYTMVTATQDLIKNENSENILKSSVHNLDMGDLPQSTQIIPTQIEKDDVSIMSSQPDIIPETIIEDKHESDDSGDSSFSVEILSGSDFSSRSNIMIPTQKNIDISSNKVIEENEEISSKVPINETNKFDDDNKKVKEETKTDHQMSTPKKADSAEANDNAQINNEINAIKRIMQSHKFPPNDVVSFNGFVIGIEPLDFIIMGKSFGGLANTTNFRLIISNIPRHQLKIFKINQNCLSLEFRSREKILEFFGYEGDFESGLQNMKTIKEKLQELVNFKDPLNFKIVRTLIHLSIGTQAVWECQSTIDELIGSTNKS